MFLAGDEPQRGSFQRFAQSLHPAEMKLRKPQMRDGGLGRLGAASAIKLLERPFDVVIYPVFTGHFGAPRLGVILYSGASVRHSDWLRNHLDQALACSPIASWCR